MRMSSMGKAEFFYRVDRVDCGSVMASSKNAACFNQWRSMPGCIPDSGTSLTRQRRWRIFRSFRRLCTGPAKDLSAWLRLPRRFLGNSMMFAGLKKCRATDDVTWSFGKPRNLAGGQKRRRVSKPQNSSRFQRLDRRRRNTSLLDYAHRFKRLASDYGIGFGDFQPVRHDLD